MIWWWGMFRVFVVFFLVVLVSGCATTSNPDTPDFSGIWFVTEFDEIIRPNENDPPYTEEALERIAFFHEHFDPIAESAVILCNPIGMPWAMLARARDYPREVYQSDDRVVIFFEYMDEYRNIYLDRTGVPDSFWGSKMGYSTAHWEGDELVVETAGYSESSEASDFQRSDEMTTIERWRLIDHPEYGESLEVEMTIYDPIIYEEPRYARALWKRGEPGSVINVYGCPATLWEDYVDEKMDQIEAAQ